MSYEKTLGAAASTAWIERRGLDVARAPHWFVEITLHTDDADTRFELNIYPEEWGFVFRRGVRVSSIRITDVAFVHGADDHKLLRETPSLESVGELLARLEERHDIKFQRMRPAVRSNLARAIGIVSAWLVRAG